MVELVVPPIWRGWPGWGRVTPARLVAFLGRSMGGVRLSLRPRDSPSARGPGSQHSMAQIATPGGRHPLPPGPQRTPMEMRSQTAPRPSDAARGTQRPRFLSQESPD